ncbi:MAG: hypothetical protein Q8O67_11135 [Deltaproteobacteria bacterium]|nr:hypothetical protein [Deltaproteobacteria bacterium]
MPTLLASLSLVLVVVVFLYARKAGGPIRHDDSRDDGDGAAPDDRLVQQFHQTLHQAFDEPALGKPRATPDEWQSPGGDEVDFTKLK